MGINPTPTNHRAFTYDGKSTREFGVYITGEGVFNAPERAVEMISIPGRDGEYALDQGHFNNIEVTYRAGIVADSTTDFAEAISNFRNWLASRKGYCRLTDEYNPNEYRMAVFKNVITVEHEGLETGEFDITFNCKPQRWLTSGETAVAVTSGGTITNPTWFPSKPLLAVDGYGNIGFNKHEINIENVTLGEITLEESLQSDGSVSFYIDTSKVNIGDPVTLNINQFGLELLALTNGGYLESNSLTVNDSNNNFHTTYTIPTPYAWNPYIDFVTTVSSPINLTVGTNATITNTVSGVWTLNTNNTITYSFETVVLYYGTTNHKVVIRRQNFSATISGNDIKQAANISGPLIKLNSATANSTVSALGNPTYIDCDIGECYMIKDDSPISLNQYIDLGSDLPTLPSGDTEVTYDNTITKVEVKPNWWKV